MAGRKTKYTEPIVRELLNGLSVGMYEKDACAAAGISVDTFANWQKRYSDFSERVSRAKAQGWRAALAVIKTQAIAGDWRAAGEFLDRTASPYRKGADTQINVTVNIRETAERIAAELGLDPADVVAEAEEILRTARQVA